MPRYQIFKTIIFLCVLTNFSCNKFLDVQPADRIIDDQVYSSKKGIENTLNGLYITMASDELYGENLTKTTIDVFAQYYTYANSSDAVGYNYYNYGNYNWTASSLQSTISDIWSNAYSVILNTNVFIDKVNPINNTNVISTNDKNIVLGEAYAIRAFIHFDLLRLFGSNYSLDSTSKYIPYKYTSIAQTDSLLPSNVVVQNINADLDSALTLLINDPIITEGVSSLNEVDDDFYKMRNRRLNYYAVQALKARLMLYRNNNTEANKIAKNVIDATSTIFPWNIPAQSLAGITNPDRVFSSEVIFGLYNFNMYTTQLDYFSAVLENYSLLAPQPTVLNTIFDNNLNDYRFRSQFALNTTTSRTFKTFYKYDDVTDKTESFRYFQPLIRISEMYYIVAETEATNDEASTYLNKVRFNRGLSGIALSNVNRTSEITKEYIREFWGEGQTYFYYKRKNLSTIQSGVSSTNATKTMTKANYIAPLPQDEQQNQ